ncbi:hypothetical protein BDZ91DRAFT_715264 [Kalaharituber pfeilii]|nr:hypothetical protein BDZ91DRAFT_715264 [Kalaharituber pfeilii]
MSYAIPVFIPRCCGIYYLPPISVGTHYPSSYPYSRPVKESWIPLTQVTANARISHYFASVTLTQTFIPPYDDARNAQIQEAKYSFPVYPSSSVISFVARVKLNDEVVKTVRGIVKTIPQAKKDYKEAVAKGETAGYLEQVEGDIFTMKLGNIPKATGTLVEVDVGYVTELKHDSEIDGIRFTIPVAIAPRYGNTPADVRATSGMKVANGLEMNVEIDMPGPVVGVQSPSHPIAVTIGSLGTSNQNSEFDNKLACAKLTQTTSYLDRDFVVQILCKDSASPRAILETHTTGNRAIDSAALMLTFVPKFVIPPSPGPKKKRKEIIFLVDRSGSMYDKIEPLKAALRVFLKSLPPNDGIRFDICSFGSRYKFLFDETSGPNHGSRLYSQSTLNEAMAHVDSMSANFGGTEIYAPLKEACSRVLKRNQDRTKRIKEGVPGEEDKVEWETELLLLTDGEVWDTEKLFTLVREHTQEWRVHGKRADERAGIRVFALGIGRDVSHAFVEGLAKAGGGYAMTVGDNERFEGKVVRMLKAALGERVGGFELTFDGIDRWKRSVNEGLDEDDYEMIDQPTATTEKTPTPAATPISLFDPSADPDSVHEAKVASTPTLVPPTLIRSPHIIPPLFAFNRTTVYLLISPHSPSGSLPLPEKIILKAVTSGGTPLELVIPVTKLSAQSSKTLHQLATKKYLDDLTEGESWIHFARGTGEKLECTYPKGEGARKDYIKLYSPDSDDWNEDQFTELVRKEGERVGVQWGVVGKWTAFVALEELRGGRVAQEQETAAQVPAQVQQLFRQSLQQFQRQAQPLQQQQQAQQQQSFTPHNVSFLRAGNSVSQHTDRRSTVGVARYSPIAPAASSAMRGVEQSFCAASKSLPMGASSAAMDSSNLQEISRRRASQSAPRALRVSSRVAENDEPVDGFENMGFALFDDDSKPHKRVKHSLRRSPFLPAPAPVQNSDATAALIDLQNFVGFWNLTSELLGRFRSRDVIAQSSKLNLASLSDVANNELELPDGIDADDRARVLATLLVIVWMQERLKSEQDTWELVVDKGLDWVNSILGNVGVAVSVHDLLVKAKDILGIA